MGCLNVKEVKEEPKVIVAPPSTEEKKSEIPLKASLKIRKLTRLEVYQRRQRDLYDKFLTSDHENYDYFTLKDEVCLAFVYSVYDGDTYVLDIKSCKGVYRWRFRTHFNTPELRTKDLVEKKHGYACRSYVANLIEKKIVIVECHGFEKYGRMIGDVFMFENQADVALVTERNIKEWKDKCRSMDQLILNREIAGYMYDGKKKSAFDFDYPYKYDIEN